MRAPTRPRLAAQATVGVVVVLQALDAAGKDGAIRHVMSGVNPQGVRVESFKVPSAADLNHDFRHRYWERLPSRGEIGIFNRSHYEEVLVVRLHRENLVRQKLPLETRGPRLEAQVRSDQQLGAVFRRERLQDREAVPQPLEGGAARPFPEAHRPARAQLEVLGARCAGAPVPGRLPGGVSQMLSHTSTEWAPWHVIPADRQWFARIAAAAVIANALIELDPQYPTLDDDALRDLQATKIELESEAPKGRSRIRSHGLSPSRRRER
nr:hypothetical protein [Kribbella capetownensis]